jgi:hypothetical protein
VGVGERGAEDDVRQVARRGRVGHQRGQLVLGHRHQLGLDAGLRGEVGEDVLRRRHAVGLELVVPDGDGLAAERAALAAPAALFVVASAAGRQREHGESGDDGIPDAHCAPPLSYVSATITASPGFSSGQR